jgi:hypothetical protein
LDEDKALSRRSLGTAAEIAEQLLGLGFQSNFSLRGHYANANHVHGGGRGPDFFRGGGIAG